MYVGDGLEWSVSSSERQKLGAVEVGGRVKSGGVVWCS
jgi:hypothetical protein